MIKEVRPCARSFKELSGSAGEEFYGNYDLARFVSK